MGFGRPLFSGPFLWRIQQHNYLVGGSFFLVWGVPRAPFVICNKYTIEGHPCFGEVTIPGSRSISLQRMPTPVPLALQTQFSGNRPVLGQTTKSTIHVACSSALRGSFKMGSKLKLCKNTKGTPYTLQQVSHQCVSEANDGLV